LRAIEGASVLAFAEKIGSAASCPAINLTVLIGNTIVGHPVPRARWENTGFTNPPLTEKISTISGILCPIGSRNLYLY
jgi:hypothetical protein